MEIILSSIGDKGDIINERIGFKVLKDSDLKYYLLFKTVKLTSGFKNKSQSCYWFTQQEVRAGDRVVLYSKSGQSSITENNDGSKTYFFYWGLTTANFVEPDDRVVLASVKTWRLLPSN